MIRISRFLALTMLAAGALFAQAPENPPANQPSFEVASIKPGEKAGGGPVRVMLMFEPGGRLNAQNVTFRMLASQAYNVRNFQIEGGPDWLNSALWNIQAKPEKSVDFGDLRTATEEQRNAFQDQMRLMIQGLLTDRFQLKIHRETKELPVYALVVDKKGLKLAPNDAATPGWQGIRMTGRGQISFQDGAMPLLTQFLSNQVGRPVLDETGLKGKYNFKLEWTPDPGQAPAFPGQPGGAPPPSEQNGPSIFTALQEQLGLKLESKKGPVDIIVIDHVEKPSEN